MLVVEVGFVSCCYLMWTGCLLLRLCFCILLFVMCNICYSGMFINRRGRGWCIRRRCGFFIISMCGCCCCSWRKWDWVCGICLNCGSGIRIDLSWRKTVNLLFLVGVVVVLLLCQQLCLLNWEVGGFSTYLYCYLMLVVLFVASPAHPCLCLTSLLVGHYCCCYFPFLCISQQTIAQTINALQWCNQQANIVTAN